MATRADGMPMTQGIRADGMIVVRADLCGRLDALEAGMARRGRVGGADHATAIATIAADYGLRPVQRLAEGLASALGAGGRGAAIGPWIEQLRDAIGCDATDEAAGSTWLAAVYNRLGG